MEIGIIALVIISISLSYSSHRWALPVLAIANRWLRWILFALFFAFIIHELSNSPAENLPQNALIGFLLYLLIETMYNWLAIGALSKSGMALFPAFRKNDQGDEWPSHKRFLATKEWLRTQGFSKSDSIKAELTEGLYLRSSVYDVEDRLTRLQILFIPQRTGNLAMCYIFMSQDEAGNRYITDNVFMPFGGFYPENWDILRKPLWRSIERLYQLHLKHIEKAEKALIRWEDEPLADLNEQQRHLENLNLQSGFLMPREEQEEHGKISGDGRYRIWKEVWVLNYLGITLSK